MSCKSSIERWFVLESRDGSTILIKEDAWIDVALNHRLSNSIPSMQNVLVDALIDSNSKTWKKDVIVNNIGWEEADRILWIPLA